MFIIILKLTWTRVALNTTKRTTLNKSQTANKTNQSKNNKWNRNTPRTPGLNTPSRIPPKFQQNLHVTPQSSRIRRAGTTDSKVAMGLPDHRRSESLSKRRPFCHVVRRLHHHIRRSLLYRKNLRLRLSQ